MTLDKNNNRAVVRHLAWRSIRKDGRTSLLTALTIALTSMLVTAMILQITGSVTSQKTALERVQQVTYMNLAQDQIEAIQTDERISSAIAYKLGPGVEEHGILIRSSYYGPSTWDMESLRLSEGRMGEKMDEIAVDKATLRAFGLPETLGARITVHFLNSSPKTFTVVGLTDYEAEGAQLANHFLYHSLQYAEYGPQLADAPWYLMARIKDGADMSGPELKNLVHQIGGEHGIAYQNVNPNDFYINLRTVKTGSLLLYTGIALALAVVSLLVIYSIFYLSVSARVRQFGQLRTIGMTPKQLKRLVKLEGWLLWGIGTPAGFTAASLFMLSFGPENGWRLSNHLAALLASAAVCAFAVRMGIRKPASIAAFASPIEAVRFQIWQGETKQMEEIPRTLTPWGLAKLNFARNLKKQILTMVSLAVGGILFMISVIYINAWQLEGYSRQGVLKNSEYEISFDYNTQNSLEDGKSVLQLQKLMGTKFQSALLQLPGVEDITSYHGVSTRFHWNGIEDNDDLTPIEPKDTHILKKYLQEGTGDYEALVQGGGVFVSMSGLWKETYGKAPQVGDEITCTYYNGQTRTVHLPVMGVGSNGVRDELTASSWLLIPRETANLLFGEMDTTETLTVSMENDSHTPAQDEQMQGFMAVYPQLQLYTLTDRMEADASSYAITKALFISISGFVVLFSLLNLLNTLLSSLITRRQELAMLAALGMTKRQIRRMLHAENLLLSGVNLTATLTLGTLCGWGVCRLMAAFGIDYMQFSFPAMWFLLYTAIAVSTPVLITHSCLKSFYRESLTERLRTAE